MRSALYEGTLVHAPAQPARNVFKYPVLYWLVDLDELPELGATPPACLVERPERRHLPRRATTSRTTAFRSRRRCSASSAEHGVELPSDARIEVLTQLRVLGYVFNPVSFYWCYRPNGELACMIAELNNTFGERLPEVLHGGSLTYEHEKRLHVSPFFGVEDRYR